MGQCPRTQAAVVSGWVGRLLDDLLRTGMTHLWMEPYLQGWLQGKLTERMLALLEKSADEVRSETILHQLCVYMYYTHAVQILTPH